MTKFSLSLINILIVSEIIIILKILNKFDLSKFIYGKNLNLLTLCDLIIWPIHNVMSLRHPILTYVNNVYQWLLTDKSSTISKINKCQSKMSSSIKPLTSRLCSCISFHKKPSTCVTIIFLQNALEHITN